MTETQPSDETVLDRFPGVRMDHLNKRYYLGLMRHELLANRCRPQAANRCRITDVG